MTAEFSHDVPLVKIRSDGLRVVVTATAAECAVLAERMGIPAVHTLMCAFTLIPAENDPGRIQATGVLNARVTRECVVSAEDFEMPVQDRFVVFFVPEAKESEDLDPDKEDEISYRGDAIDLGEAAAEQLALALDPYPRIEGATMAETEPDADQSPFAALAKLRGTGGSA
ncbi:MAG: DUF177 domain-containing protein [Acetobacteraceae bacterium]|nr:DUF177 domain-containing protein [Acetobacteraceae bacterium]